APVRGMGEALDEAELAGRGMLSEYEHPVLGTVRSVGSPIRAAGFDPAYRAAPALGADAADVLREAGYDEAAVDRLAQQGAFGGPLQAGSRVAGTAEGVADACAAADA